MGDARRISRATYGWLRVKFPLPEQPETPVRVQVPVMVFPLTVPERVRRLLVVGNMVVTVIPNVPITVPLELPPNPKVPVSAVVEGKQGLGEVIVKLVTVTELPLAWAKFAEKPKAVLPLASVRFAIQVPLMLLEPLLLLLPHPASTNPNDSRPIIHIFLILAS